MSQNIEIKAHYPNIKAGRDIAGSIGAKYLGCDHQLDTYFKTKNGRLKIRESSISGAVLIPYIRENKTKAKTSNYALIELANANTVKALFSHIFGIDTIVEKERHIYLIDNVRIHLDKVVELGCFLEFEAVCSRSSVIKNEQFKIKKLMNVFKINNKDLINDSYRELKFNKRRRSL
ncbi:MAG: class IV adenylate cyclase [Pseudomonadota bacterium]